MRPIEPPRLHDVRLSRAVSASRRAWRLSARARGRASERGGTSAESRKRELCVLMRTGRSVGARSREVETFFWPETGRSCCRPPSARPALSPAARPGRPRPCSRPSLTARPRVARSPGTGAAAVGGRAAEALTGERAGRAGQGLLFLPPLSPRRPAATSDPRRARLS